VKSLIPNIALTAVLFASLAYGQQIAFTFDDGPDMTDAIGLNAEQRNTAILAQLADAHLKSFLFVTRIDNDPVRNALIVGGENRATSSATTRRHIPIWTRSASKTTSATS
jgi:hypothetical protein